MAARPPGRLRQVLPYALVQGFAGDGSERDLRAEAAALEARIRGALSARLASRLSLRDYTLRAGHYFHLVATSDEGGVFVNFFPVDESSRVRRIVASHGLLAGAGAAVPELLDFDVGGEVDPGLAWVALRWHPGRPLTRKDRVLARRALGELARIHTIEREAASAAAVAELPFFPDFGAFAEEAGPVVAMLRSLGIDLPDDEAARVQGFLQRGVDGMSAEVPAPPIVLLHADFQPANLQLTPAGRLMILDLEGASFGAFPFDLVRAVYKFRFKVKASELDRLPLDELMRDPGIGSLCEAYLEVAGPVAREFWSVHARTILFYGYLKMIRRRAKAALDPVRYGWVGRLRSRMQAEERWRAAVRYVDGAGSGC